MIQSVSLNCTPEGPGIGFRKKNYPFYYYSQSLFKMDFELDCSCALCKILLALHRPNFN